MRNAIRGAVREAMAATDVEISSTKEVPAPTRPLPVARKFVEDVYTSRAGIVLRHHEGGFYRYNGTSWPEVEEREVRAEAYRYLEDAVFVKVTKEVATLQGWDPTRHRIDNVLDALRAAVLLEGGEAPMWTDGTTDPPAHETISMSNGLLHVPTRTLRAHTPAFFTYHSLPFGFDPRAPRPTNWLAFLDQLWRDDPSSISTLQEVFGYLLGGDTRQQKIFLLVGPKRGGKGTIGRVLTGLLGPHNVAAPTMAGLGTNFGLQPLIGSPLALVSDARMSGKADSQVVVERLLSISGEDSLTIDRKFRDPWTGRLPTRFMILTNELPRLSDSSGALSSRFVLFVLTRSFLGREDPGLTDKLLTEAPGIFNWALEGLDRLNLRGRFEPPPSGREALQQLEDLTSPISAFVREKCTVGGGGTVPVDDLWNAWKDWCIEDNRHSGTKAVFGRNLSSACPTIRKARPRAGNDRVHVYTGIGLIGKTMPGHPDHPDHTPWTRQRSGGGHGSRSQQEPFSGNDGQGGHGEYETAAVKGLAPDHPDRMDPAEPSQEDRQYLRDEREGMQADPDRVGGQPDD
ncbi:MAG: phage/plasmid primase, P4 family [Gemmatimonadota bacterium]